MKRFGRYRRTTYAIRTGQQRFFAKQTTLLQVIPLFAEDYSGKEDGFHKVGEDAASNEKI
ncbi:MAG: hypothetical protein SPI71_03235 [Acidaminococcaceae bacterium]|nr:hypothetical protein [Acidaminococcaceae bacterium]